MFSFNYTRGMLLTTAALGLSLGQVAAAENWPTFRGDGARGISENNNLPLEWDAKQNKNIEWKTAVPGLGWSTRWTQRPYLPTSAVSDGEIEPRKPGLYFGGDRKADQAHAHFLVLCLDLKSGVPLAKKCWHHVPDADPYQKQLRRRDAGDRWRTGLRLLRQPASCLDKTGKVLWKKMFKPYEMRNGWGTGASPILDGDQLIIVNDNMEDSWMASFDKRTGRQLWKTKRDEPSNWSTPYVWKHDGIKELILTGRNRTRAYDLKGNERWSLKWKTRTSIVIPTPFEAHGLLYIASGYVGDREKHVYAIRPGAKGDISLKSGETKNKYIAWYDRRAGPYNPSPLVYGDEFYTLFDFGFLGCRNAKTGEVHYDKERINPEKATGFTASPWAYRGHVFALR